MIPRRTSSIPKEDVVFPRLLFCDVRCYQVCCRGSQAGRRHSHVLPGLSLALLGAPRCTRWPLNRSSKLRDLTTLGFWSNNSRTLPEAPSAKNTFCWCGGRSCPGEGNDNDNGEGEEDTQGHENGTGKGNGKWMGRGKARWLRTESGNGRARRRQWKKGSGSGRETMKGKVL